MQELLENAVAKGGQAIAMYDLGFVLERGADGVERDALRAMELHEGAIEKAGRAEAMYNLDCVLDSGAG